MLEFTLLLQVIILSVFFLLCAYIHLFKLLIWILYSLGALLWRSSKSPPVFGGGVLKNKHFNQNRQTHYRRSKEVTLDPIGGQMSPEECPGSLRMIYKLRGEGTSSVPGEPGLAWLAR